MRGRLLRVVSFRYPYTYIVHTSHSMMSHDSWLLHTILEALDELDVQFGRFLC
jgi:hypothetical protein